MRRPTRPALTQALRQPRTRHTTISPPQLRTQHSCRRSACVTVQVTVSAVDLEATYEASLEAGLEAAQDTSHHHQSTTGQDSAHQDSAHQEAAQSETSHDHTWHATEQPSRSYQHRQQPSIKGKNPFFNFKLHSDYCQAWTPPDRLVVGAWLLFAYSAHPCRPLQTCCAALHPPSACPLCTGCCQIGLGSAAGTQCHMCCTSIGLAY